MISVSLQSLQPQPSQALSSTMLGAFTTVVHWCT